MKKIYFLISIFIFGLLSSVIVNNSNIKNNNLTANNINIANDKYLSLTYQNGKFFSWNQDNIDSEHYIGVFTSADGKSYLLSNTGVFTNLDYEIINLTRINNNLAIAQLSYYSDNNGVIWTNKNFIVEIDNSNHFVVAIDTIINSSNNNFVVLDDNTFLSYGIGLDLITVSGSTITVTNKIPAYEGGFYATYFYALSADTGIFINGDQNYYYLTDIKAAINKVPLNITALANFANNVSVIDSNSIVLRNSNAEIFYYDLLTMTATDLNFSSFVNNFCFVLNSTDFVINTSTRNYSDNFGIPYLIKATNLAVVNPIETKNSLIKIVLTNPTAGTGIFIDGTSFAYSFQFASDSFTFENIGNINQYQFVNQNLGFATYNGSNLLLNSVANNNWLFQKSIIFSAISSETKVNFLNNIINASSSSSIDDKNSYFANGFLHLNITNENLISVTITSEKGLVTLNPVNNNITYNFDDFIKYSVTIDFLTNGTHYIFDYQVKIDDFTENNLLNIFSTNIINYVGINNNQLYDIQAINEDFDFTITAFNYNILQSVQLIRYDTSLVVRSINNVKENDIIAPEIVDKYALKEYLCALKIDDLLNQTKMIYLGFIQNDGTKPMINFWDTEQGKTLRKAALARNYSATQLDNMNAAAINNLIMLETTWNLIKVQATTLAYIIIGAITISSLIALYSVGYNWYLEKLIRIKNKNKMEVL